MSLTTPAACVATANAEQLFGRLQGLLCLYKARGTTMASMKKKFASRMTKNINTKEQRPMRQMVKIHEENVGTSLPVVTVVPDLSDHPLVTGPRFIEADFELHPINPLADESSGVQLFGFGEFGRGLTDRFAVAKPVHVYHVTGKLGLSTDNFLESGRLVERAEFGHVNETRLNRVIQAWQATHRDLMFRETGIDYGSQAAFEAASRGFVRPKADFRSAVFIACQLVKFRRPYFTVEVHATNGECVDLHELIHHLGIEARTRAAVARVHRLRAGPFSLEEALLFKEWSCDSCVENSERNSRMMDAMEKQMLESGGTALDVGGTALDERLALAAAAASTRLDS